MLTGGPRVFCIIDSLATGMGLAGLDSDPTTELRMNRSLLPASCQLLVACMALMLICMGSSGATQTPAGPVEAVSTERVIAAGSDAASDQQIRRRIRQIFDEIDGLSDVRVDVIAGVVKLSGQALELAAAEKARALAARVEGVVEVRQEIALNTDVSAQVSPVLKRMSDRLTQVVAGLPLLGIGLFVFALIALLAWWLTRPGSFWTRIAPNAFISQLLRQAVLLVSLMLASVVALELMGATGLLGTILGTAGIAGLAFGFAIRDTVENYVASIILSLRQPFSPGDFIEIDGQQGHVARMTSRATILYSPDGNHVSIPNATVFKQVIINFTRDPQRRFEFAIDIDSDDSIERAIAVIIRCLNGLSFVLDDPKSSVSVSHAGSVRTTLNVYGWINQNLHDFSQAHSEAIRLVRRALLDAGLFLSDENRHVLIDRADRSSRSASSSEQAAGQKHREAETGPAQESPIAGQDASKAKALAESRSGAGTDLLSGAGTATLE